MRGRIGDGFARVQNIEYVSVVSSRERLRSTAYLCIRMQDVNTELTVVVQAGGQTAFSRLGVASFQRSSS